MISTEVIYEWKMSELPNRDNKVARLVKKMNRYSKMPWPYNRHAYLIRKQIQDNLSNFAKITFGFDMFMLYGNIYGGSVWCLNTYMLDYAPIYFGNHVTIGPDVKLITSWHDHENFNIVKAKSIIIEDNVWITMDSIILPGVTIGKNSVIGAGSIVTKSIPPNSLAAGNPAKVIKSINRDYEWWNERKVDLERTNVKKENNINKYIPGTIKNIIKAIRIYVR